MAERLANELRQSPFIVDRFRFTMPRSVIPPPLPSSDKDREGWVTRLIKYVPTEILSAYVVISSLLLAVPEDGLLRKVITLALIIIFTLLTFIYFFLKIPAGGRRTAHLIVSPIAFLAWSYPLSVILLGDWFVMWVSAIIQVVTQIAVLVLALFFVPGPDSADGGFR